MAAVGLDVHQRPGGARGARGRRCRPGAEDGRQKTEDRRQRTEDAVARPGALASFVHRRQRRRSPAAGSGVG